MPKQNNAAVQAATPAVKKVGRTEVEKQGYLADFTKWDNHHYNLVKYVKSVMNDPNSFEHVETGCWRKGTDSVVIKMTYRGKNGFGGVINQDVRATAHVDSALGTVNFD